MKRRNFIRDAALAGCAFPFMSTLDSVQMKGEERKFQKDTIVVNGLDPSILSEEYVAMQQSAGVDCWVKSSGSLRSFSDTYNFIDAHHNVITVVRTMKEIRQAKQDGKLGIVFEWQSADVLSGTRKGENDWWSEVPRTNLRSYYELGLRMCGICYQIANVFGGGAIDGHIGLTKAGRRLVEEIHKLRIILDVGGHTGDRTAFDALEISSGVPVICSHANTRALANSTRNLSDEVIEEIAKTGGVIGLVPLNDYVVRGNEMAHLDTSPLGTVDDYVKHADHIKKLVGAKHVGLGPDFTFGMSRERDRALFGHDAQDKGLRRYVKGFEKITELPNVINSLRQHGWTEIEIQGFLGDNWLRVYEKVWGA
jgi:membrane dipeptidase